MTVHDHLFGSFVLSEVGGIIRQNIRAVDIGARYGGDEFFDCFDRGHARRGSALL